jgi:putative ABC transport system permease protein
MASIRVIFGLAIATLLENRLRSALTLLGMMFGSAAVIATLSSSEGAQQYVNQQLQQLGTRLMVVESSGLPIEDSDLLFLKKYLQDVDAIARDESIGPVQIRFESNTIDTEARAAHPDFLLANNLSISVGRSFSNDELEGFDAVAIIGHKLRETLFGINQPFVGSIITVKSENASLAINIIGALKEKGGNEGASLDQQIFINPNFARKISKSTSQNRIVMLLNDPDKSAAVKLQAASLLKPAFSAGEINIVDAREAIERTKAIWSKQNLVGICLATISLLTGGVGIMNVMLLSIHQRRKEIGLRKAIGAQDSEIAVQFLVETVLICVMGGLLGVVAGLGFGQQVAKMLGQWEAVISSSTILLAVGFSIATGLIFGLIPALRASRIDPYDALRTG